MTRWRIVHRRRRRSGSIASRARVVEASSLRVGRSTHSEVHLPDPRIQLDHAVLELHRDGVVLRTAGEHGIEVDHVDVQQIHLALGQEVRLGPFSLAVSSTEEADACVTFELVDPLPDDLEGLEARSGLSMKGQMPVSTLSMVGCLGILALGLALPAAALVLGVSQSQRSTALMMWSTGPLANVHRHFEQDCQACHADQGFGVSDAACLACHTGQTHHADPAEHPVVEAECAECHQDHGGEALLSTNADRFCVRCHADPERWASGTELRPVHDFSRSHGELRATVITDSDGGTRRVPLDDPPPVEASNLTFGHDVHLAPEGVLGPDGDEVLQCDSCHQRRRGSALMDPLEYETACQRCHPIGFETWAPDRTLPHAPARLVQALAGDVYRAMLREGETPPPTPTQRRPGDPAPLDVTQDPESWLAARLADTRTPAFGRAACAPCHEVEAAVIGWDVLPVRVSDRWLPAATFDHGAHTVTACTECHPATRSATSADVLVPGLATCRSCHGDRGVSGKVVSQCSSCHPFHRDAMPPMGAPAAPPDALPAEVLP